LSNGSGRISYFPYGFCLVISAGIYLAGLCAKVKVAKYTPVLGAINSPVDGSKLLVGTPESESSFSVQLVKYEERLCTIPDFGPISEGVPLSNR
jgi:hypothetical protein